MSRRILYGCANIRSSGPGMGVEFQSGGRFRTGLFEIHRPSGEVFEEGRRVHVQEQPFQVLTLLLQRPGRRLNGFGDRGSFP